jgi:MFS family permease
MHDNENTADMDTSPPSRGLMLMQWRIVFASMIALLCGASTLTIFGLGMFVKPLQAEFGWSLTQISLANTIVSFCCVVSSIAQGILIDRFGARRIVLISVPLLGVSFALMYFLPNDLRLFYLAWLLIPLLGVGTWTGAYAKVISAWFDRRLGVALGIASIGVGLGSALMPPLTHALLSLYGWRVAYMGIGVLSVGIALPVVYFNLYDTPASRGMTVAPRAAHRAAPESEYRLSQAFRLRTFWFLVASFALLGFVTTGVATHLVPMLMNAGIDGRHAALGQSLLGIGLIAGRLTAGYCLDRFPAVTVSTVSLLGPVLGCGGYAIFGIDINSMYLFASLIGIGIGAEFDLLGFYVRRYFGKLSYGKLYGSIFASFQFGSGIGSVAVAAGTAYFGGYAPMLALMAGLVAVVIGLLPSLGPMPGAARDDDAATDRVSVRL